MSLRIGVLTVGDELLSGEMADGNTARIAAVLGSRGFRLRESLTVGDIEEDIVAALQGLASRRDVVIVTGGLGPTADDITARAASRAFGLPMTLSDEALEQIRTHFRRRNLPMHPRNEKQALLPQKTAILPNQRGTAPGFLLHHQQSDLFFLPGVPDEMSAMLEDSVLPRLETRGGEGSPGQERLLKIFGLAEPRVEELLADAGLSKGVELRFGVDYPYVHAKLRCAGGEADDLLDRAELTARRALGDMVVACGDETLEGNVVRLASACGVTLALAESCTGGMASKMLTDVPGASAVLDRTGVTYADRAKRDWLGVPARLIETEGAVSEACARAMAGGLRRSAGCDVAVAITGIAGPGGGSPHKPVGTVYLALDAPDVQRAEGFRFAGDRHKVRRMAAVTALDWLRRYLADRLGST